MSESMPTRRRPLSRRRALEAAVALADAEGIDAVSMRQLADRLGVVPMALYKHVANKEDLLDGMVETVVAGYIGLAGAPGDPGAVGPGETSPGETSPGETSPGATDWRTALRDRVLAARRAVVAHPWLRPVIETRRRRTPAVLAHMDALAGLLLAGGMSVDLTHHAMHALGHRIWGFSPEAFTDAAPPAMPVDPAERQALVDQWMASYPNIVAIAESATAGDLSRVGQGCDEQFEFEFALDLLLDAFERLRDDGWSSAGRSAPSTRPT